MAKKAATRTATRSRKPAAKRAAARTPDNMSVWKGIVTKAWKDPAFRDRLIDDPNGVLAEYGFKQKKGTSYRVVADSKDTKHLILPESAKSLRVKPVSGGKQPDPGF